MAKLTFKGIEKFVQQLESISENSEGDIKQALYKGAGIVADEIRRSLTALSTSEDGHGLTPEEKRGILSGFGLSKMENRNGFINTKAGFNGLSGRLTKRHPNGVPNATIMRQIESGTSRIRKQPVIRQATTRAKEKAESAMAAEIDKLIKKHQNGG